MQNPSGNTTNAHDGVARGALWLDLAHYGAGHVHFGQHRVAAVTMRDPHVPV